MLDFKTYINTAGNVPDVTAVQLTAEMHVVPLSSFVYSVLDSEVAEIFTFTSSFPPTPGDWLVQGESGSKYTLQDMVFKNVYTLTPVPTPEPDQTPVEQVPEQVPQPLVDPAPNAG